MDNKLQLAIKNYIKIVENFCHNDIRHSIPGGPDYQFEDNSCLIQFIQTKYNDDIELSNGLVICMDFEKMEFWYHFIPHFFAPYELANNNTDTNLVNTLIDKALASFNYSYEKLFTEKSYYITKEVFDKYVNDKNYKNMDSDAKDELCEVIFNRLYNESLCEELTNELLIHFYENNGDYYETTGLENLNDFINRLNKQMDSIIKEGGYTHIEFEKPFPKFACDDYTSASTLIDDFIYKIDESSKNFKLVVDGNISDFYSINHIDIICKDIECTILKLERLEIEKNNTKCNGYLFLTDILLDDIEFRFKRKIVTEEDFKLALESTIQALSQYKELVKYADELNEYLDNL